MLFDSVHGVECSSGCRLGRMVEEPGAALAKAQKALIDYQRRVSGAVSLLDHGSVTTLVLELLETRKREGTVFIAGNGGSASTAGHIAVDWMIGTSIPKPPLRVISLAENNATVTALGNDHSFGSIFSRQLLTLGKPDDLLVAISASGNSENLIEAAELAQNSGMKVCAITGFDGGALKKLSDIAVHVPTEIGDYGVAEDAHLVIGHAVKEALIMATQHA